MKDSLHTVLLLTDVLVLWGIVHIVDVIRLASKVPFNPFALLSHHKLMTRSGWLTQSLQNGAKTKWKLHQNICIPRISQIFVIIKCFYHKKLNRTLKILVICMNKSLVKQKLLLVTRKNIDGVLEVHSSCVSSPLLDMDLWKIDILE